MLSRLKKLLRSTKGAVSSIVGAVVGLVIAVVVIVAVIPTIVDTIQDTNTTGWDFTGYEGAISLLELIPFIVIAGALLLAVAMGLRMGKQNS